jgi:photosystem II stability/assembly factor-like uncharacterized protein
MASGGALLAATSGTAGAVTLWSPQTAPATVSGSFLQGVDFVNQNDGWAVSNNGRIIATTDGGSTWFQQISTGHNLTSVSFTNASDGIAVGFSDAVYFTTNGGSTWTAAATPPTGGSSLFGVSMVNSHDAWTVGTVGVIFASTDGGNTWAAETSGTAHDLSGVDFVSATSGYAVGQDGAIEATTNGGTTWAPEISGTFEGLTSVDFVDASHGHAVGSDGTILSTVDGGTTWTPQVSGLASPMPALYSVSFGSDNVGWISGNNGTILATTDDGQTWTQETSGVSLALFAVSAVDASHAWIVGSGGTILAYTNPNANPVTQLVLTSSSTDVIAGSTSPQLTVTVTAEDSFGDVVPGYLGTVHFTSSDAQAVLPADATLTNGTGTFNVTLKTATQPDEAAPAPVAQTISATAVNAPTITPGVTAGIEVDPAPTAKIVWSPLPATATANQIIPFTATAEDAFGNTATGYNGTVRLSIPDGASALGNFVNGLFSGGVEFAEVGTNQHAALTDTTDPSITGTSSGVDITPSAAGADTFAITPHNTSETAGVPFTVTVTAHDQFGNVDTNFSEPVHFTSSDAGAKLPVSVTQTGTDTYSITLETQGSQTLTVTTTSGPTVTTTTSYTVTPAGATKLVLSGVPGSATAGGSFNFTVTAEDGFGNTVAADDDTIGFTSTDAKAVLPASVTLVHGVASGVSATLKTATDPPEASGLAGQTITATDGLNLQTTTSAPITVNPAAFSTFTISVPTTAQAGVPFSPTIEAVDSYGNVDSNLTVPNCGPIFDMPANVNVGTLDLTKGVDVPSITLNSSGSQVLEVADACTSIGVTEFFSSPINVTAAPATKLIVTTPPTVTAGTPFTYTVMAEDALGNIDTNFTDPVSFTSSDGQAVLPGVSNVTNGSATFTATLKTATKPPESTGVLSETITATDTLHPSISGISDPTVDPGVATHIVLTAASPQHAGTSFSATVTAYDAYGNVALGDTHTVHFTSDDTAAVLPAAFALVDGVGSASVTLKTAGTKTLTATDSLTAQTSTVNIVVNPATTGDTLMLSAPASVTSGVPFTFTVTAKDAFGNTDTGYTGTVHFTSTDTSAGVVLPANATLTNGVGTFNATLEKAGSQTITGTDTVTAATTGSTTILVNPGPVSQLSVVSLNATPTAGVAFGVTVTAEDAFGNTVTSFPDNIGITTTDAESVLPPNAHLLNGVGTFSVTLDTAGLETITATDLVTPTLHNATSVTVSPATAADLIVSAPTTVTAGHAFNATVTAYDQFGNVVTSDNSALSFSTSSALSILPLGKDLSSGTGTFSFELNTAGTQTLTASETATPSVTGTTSTNVVADTATQFAVVAPATEEAGVPITFSVTAEDEFANVATTFSSTVHFTSSTVGASGRTLPADSTLTNGVGTFSATFTKTGTQTITATSPGGGGITGTSNTILVTPAPAAYLTLVTPATVITHTPFTFSVTAHDQYGNVATQDDNFIHVLSSDPDATLPNNVTLTAGIGTFSATLDTVGDQTLTATDFINPSVTGTNTIDVLPGPAVDFVVTGAPQYVIEGTPFALTVTAYDQWGNVATTYTGTVHLTSSDPKAVLPANTTLSAGVGTITVTLNSLGTQSVTATDTLHSSITGSASTIVVYPPPVAGYMLAGADGGAFNIGEATGEGSVTNPINKPVVGIATTPDGLGYWEVATDGGIFSFGDAAFYGSTGALTLNKPIVGMARTPDGKGYWLVASDGGVFSFGDAKFYGSTGSLHLNQPIVGMAATPDGKGYLLVASDGGIFAFGDAAFNGSLGSLVLNQPIVGMALTGDGNGYWLVAKDGGVFTFGDAPFLGSLPAEVAVTTQSPSQAGEVNDVVGITATSDHRGYWVAEKNATVHGFGDAGQFGPPLNNAGFAPNDIVGISAEP